MSAQPIVHFAPTLSPQDVAALTGLHYSTVLEEIRSGALRAAKRRGRYLITAAAYEAWLEPDDVSARGNREELGPPARPSPGAPPAVGSVARLRALEGGASTDDRPKAEGER